MKNYYLGLDIGTDSIGYAVTDKEYNILKFKGEPAWGVHLFDSANLAADRRTFRVARRRIERRKQRITLLQELFASEINKIDPRFFIRQQQSALFPEDKPEANSLFNDDEYTDKEYHKQYPTIHHLITDLMYTDEPRDLRLVYLACAWLVAHRGHFLNEIDSDNIDGITDFSGVYKTFEEYFIDHECALPFDGFDINAFAAALHMKSSLTKKSKALIAACFKSGKVPKPAKGEDDPYPYNCEALLKGLCGCTINAKDLFKNDAYSEIGSFTLGSDDEKLAEIMGGLGEDAELIERMKALYDWSLLVDILDGSKTVSEAKVEVYNQHEKDLKLLKYIIKKYLPGRYKEVFTDSGAASYTAYSYHGELAELKRKASQPDFCAYIRKVIGGIKPDEADAAAFADMSARLERDSFMPKQKNTDNRVIPYQLYRYELKKILDRAEKWYPFLSEKDEDGLSVSDKILSIFVFRVPYFVGPLNAHSVHAWVKRLPGRITPWNFEKMVDLDETEKGFIDRLINRCTYLPDERVLPKDSLLYHRFSVLNEINPIRINDRPISVETKKRIYNELFMKKRKVTTAQIKNFLIKEGVMGKEDLLSGIDITIKSDLKPQHDFMRLMQSGTLSAAQVENIIEHRSYSEDAFRFKKWLQKEYSFLSKDDLNYIGRLNYKDFGRLSARFLNELEGVDQGTGEITTVLNALWETNCTLMELLSDKYTFRALVEKAQQEYYEAHPADIAQRLDEMYVSAAVKRPIMRTMEIVKEVSKAFGAPEKIFVEMARGGLPEQKGQRTKSRRDQLLDLYDKCADEDVRLLKKQLEDMGAAADSRLQSDKLFLYYCQLGKCMYTGKSIDVEQLMHKDEGAFNIEHIYPRAAVSDDSIINNKVLVDSKVNGEKKDSYPIDGEIRAKMYGFWSRLRACGLISDEKFKRLTRSTPFSEDERWGFINRQLTETTQSTKAVAELLKEVFPKAEIVYVKARLASEFRQEFDCVKSRTYNDLHHAKDAYLNIVTGNVYSMKFTKRWFNLDKQYSVRIDTLFKHELVCGNETVWDGTDMLEKVKGYMRKNNIHMTRYSFVKQGGFFDQMPLKADAGLVPRKKDLPAEKYGGYNKPGVCFFVPVRYKVKKKMDIMIMPVELLHKNEMLGDDAAALAYAKQQTEKILGKAVDEVSFPMGKRLIKINTVLSLDGFEVVITGGAGGGSKIITAPFTAFVADAGTERYIKRLESLRDKHAANPSFVYSPGFDKVTPEENLTLYKLYYQKLSKTIYQKRVNNPKKTLEKGEQKFQALDIFAQAEALLRIHTLFSKMSSGGCDLSSIGGAAHEASTTLSTNISNWKKSYSDVRIIDRAASGLWQQKSENLLELL